MLWVLMHLCLPSCMFVCIMCRTFLCTIVYSCVHSFVTYICLHCVLYIFVSVIPCGILPCSAKLFYQIERLIIQIFGKNCFSKCPDTWEAVILEKYCYFWYMKSIDTLDTWRSIHTLDTWKVLMPLISKSNNTFQTSTLFKHNHFSSNSTIQLSIFFKYQKYRYF